jgi:Mn2+/Fe2+ NRAMP family transporter
MPVKTLLNKLGPGLLYAAAAIGVSHLVQSTRAGASYGNQLIWAVIVANILKYPFFRTGPQYTAITGKSLLHGYRQKGSWSILIFFLITLGTMFTVQAAVTIVTAGLAKQLFVSSLPVTTLSTIVILVCALILVIGRYHVLDNLIKFIIILLTATTIISVIGALFGQVPKPAAPTSFSFGNETHLFFFIALVGWMPAPLDVPIWHSMWSLAKNVDKHEKTSVKDALLDFKIGYIGTAILAVCFLLLGSLVMYRSGETFSSSAGVFAGQLINMYTQSLGSWAYPIIAIAAFTTMFSTTLTVLDAFPRILREATYVIKNDPALHAPKWYNIWLIITIAGALTILFGFLNNMKALVDLATTLSFVVAPFFAIMNYLVMKSDDIPTEHQPKGFINIMSIVGILFLTSFSIWFIVIRFF